MKKLKIMLKICVTAFTFIFLNIKTSFAEETKTEFLTSIKPIYLIIKEVVGDKNNVNYIVKNSNSPHGYKLKPSQIKEINNSKIIFYISNSFETFLEKPLEKNKNLKKIVLMEKTNIKKLDIRKGGVWEKHNHDEEHADHDEEHADHDEEHADHDEEHADHDDEHADHNDEHHNHKVDKHIWLSPSNAIQIAKVINTEINKINPKNTEFYNNNTKKLIAKIKKTIKSTKNVLKTNKQKQFIVFHDAYQYFDKFYGLNPAGSISLDPHEFQKPKRIKQLRERIVKNDITCLFTEPQFSKKPIETLTSTIKKNIKIVEIDPLGSNSNSYVDFMNKLTTSFQNCLK